MLREFRVVSRMDRHGSRACGNRPFARPDERAIGGLIAVVQFLHVDRLMLVLFAAEPARRGSDRDDDGSPPLIALCV